MNPASTKIYRENRAKFPPEELRKRDGQWVAFSADGLRIVGSPATIAELAEQLRAAQEDLQNVVLERMDMESMEINLGAAELQ
jgi:alkanesulfonate monooxygenase SsuD/methylene tetrahydromethanopterin reductase-like flavin-dependent oxidoreductase (luciferase family)